MRTGATLRMHLSCRAPFCRILIAVADVTDIWSNVVLRERHKSELQELTRLLPPLEGCAHSQYLSLGRFFDGVPERFFCRDTFSGYWKFLESEHGQFPTRLRDALREEQADLNQALFFLDEVNRRDWHDRMEDGDDFEKLRFIDSHLHPDYLRLVDGVYFRFVRVVALISRLTRGAGTDGLDLYNAVQELKNTPLSGISDAYHHVMRNGVAHGGVTFGQNEITYTDKKGNSETRSVYEVVRLVDDMVDVCNGMALACSLFLFVHLHDGFSIPRHLLIRELQAETRSPWWRVEGCVPCRIPQGSQLLIYGHPNTRDTMKAHFYAFYTAVLAEFLAPGYDRYFLSLRSEKALPGFAAFDGGALKRVRVAGPSDMSDYKGVLVDDLIMYSPRIKLPRIMGKLDTQLQAAKVHFPIAATEIRRSLNRPVLLARAASMHRNGRFSVLSGSVVISPSDGEASTQMVRSSCGRIIAKVRSLARKRLRTTDPARFLPVGWGRVAVFRRDFRERRLRSFGLGADLICTVQVQRLQRVRAPDIVGSTIEEVGRYRIAWNKAWLDDVGK